MTTPTVSIIVPNYNYARYLDNRLETILNQTYQDFELILLDDCSNDNSREIMESYRGNPKVSHIVFNEENSGSPFVQWTKGIEMAQGEYIWIAEADDWAEPDFLEKCISLLTRDKSAVIAFTGSYIVDENNEIKRKQDYDRWKRKHLSSHSKYAIYSGEEYLKRNLFWRNYIYNASGTVFKKSSFHNITNFKWKDMRCCGDWLFWSLIAIQGNVIEIYERLNRFRRHSASTIATSIPNGINLEESILVISEIEKICPSIDRYRRHINHGNIYKHIIRQHFSEERKHQLIDLMKNLFGSVKLSYIIARINKFLANIILIRVLNFPKTDRCTPKKPV